MHLGPRRGARIPGHRLVSFSNTNEEPMKDVFFRISLELSYALMIIPELVL